MEIGPIHFRAKNRGTHTRETGFRIVHKRGRIQQMLEKREKKAPRRELLWCKYY
jgi:hypothetical protein